MIKDLATEIKNLSEKMQLSQHRFGKKIGVKGKTICAYEHSRATPSLKVFEKIAEVYGVSLSDSNKKKNAKIRELLEAINKELNDLFVLTES